MKPNYRIPLFITLIVASVGMGTVAVHASTDCQHLLRDYQQQIAKSVHHKVSGKTLARWAAWNKAHPSYRPRPTAEESIAKVDFACEVPMGETAMTQDLPPVELPPLLTSMTDAFPTPSQPTIIANNELPPEIPPQSSPQDPIYAPGYYPGPPTLFGGGSFPPTLPLTPTPEPASLMLVTTAFGFLLGLVYWKRYRSGSFEPQAILS